jgi:SAM-dependent methyltransferase
VAGDVLDLACGYGYGAEVLARNSRLTSYVGIDVSEDAVRNAQQLFGRAGREYRVGSGTSIPLPDASVDGIVSLETLEHIERPAEVVREFRRVLRPRGILVGSVPSREFDDLAERVYGPNPYHITRFDRGELESLLAGQFATVRIYYSALEIATHVGTLDGNVPAMQETATFIRERRASHVAGSFHFVASDLPAAEIDALHSNQIYVCSGMTEHDELKVQPLRRRAEDADALVAQKDAVIANSETLVRERDELLRVRESMIREQEGMISERDELIMQLRQQTERLHRELAVVPRAVRRVFAKLRGSEDAAR